MKLTTRKILLVGSLVCRVSAPCSGTFKVGVEVESVFSAQSVHFILLGVLNFVSIPIAF